TPDNSRVVLAESDLGPRFGIDSWDSGTYGAYVTALAAFCIGVLFHRADLRVRGAEPHERSFQPDCPPCGQPGNGISLRLADRTVLVGPGGLGFSAQRGVAAGISVDGVLHGHLHDLPDKFAWSGRLPGGLLPDLCSGRRRTAGIADHVCLA